jgi:hypothetical protein
LSVHSKNRYWWKCEKGHEWEATLYKRNMGRGCHYCSHQKVTPENSLAVKFPELLKEWDYNKNIGIDPEKINSCYNKKVWWKCCLGHEWQISPCSRVSVLEHNCPYCAHQILTPENSLSFKFPELLKEWDYSKNIVTPDKVFARTTKKFWWKCNKGHEWECSISARTGPKSNCPYCCNQKINKGNSLSTTHKFISSQWDYGKNYPLTPDDVSAGSEKKVWWKCEKGHEWESLILNRKHGNGCPHCHKIELKDGTICDSYIEAYYCLLLKESGIEFFQNKNYPFKKEKKFEKHKRYDFYLPLLNLYIEVTSFSKKFCFNKKDYIKYLRNIANKKKNVFAFGANFEFIQRELNQEEKLFVVDNMKAKDSCIILEQPEQHEYIEQLNLEGIR